MGGVIQGSAGADYDGADGTARYELELRYNIAPSDLLHLHLEGGNGDGITVIPQDVQIESEAAIFRGKSGLI